MSLSHTKTDTRTQVSAGLLLILFLALWSYALFYVTTESHQGEVYRILYVHVPSAFSAFAASFFLFIFSIMGLKENARAMNLGKSTAEVGLLFTLATLATGSIWGKPTWGVWWTWDARLTTTFILSLLYCGYLLMWSSMPPSRSRTKVCSVLGILIFADVPIIYKSVTWWRTLHQPPSILRTSGSSMSSEILYFLLASSGITIFLALWLIWQRSINLSIRDALDQASIQQLEKQEGN